MQQPDRWIAHLDMDAFYASVELLRYPQLKGEAVVIGGRRADAPRQLEDGTWQYARLRNYTGRGVVTTSTYAARDLGVFSAMGLMKAALRAPDAILLPAAPTSPTVLPTRATSIPRSSDSRVTSSSFRTSAGTQ